MGVTRISPPDPPGLPLLKLSGDCEGLVKGVEVCQFLLQTHVARAQTTPRPATLGFPLVTGYEVPAGVPRARPLSQSEHSCEK